MISFDNDRTDTIVMRELKNDDYFLSLVSNKSCEYYIDIGANHGLVFDHLLKNGFNFKKSVLIEPSKYNYNILSNKYNDTNIVTLNLCIGVDKSPQKLLSSQKNNSGSCHFGYDNENTIDSEVIESITLSDIIVKYNIDPCKTLIKCDCEGGEIYLMCRENLEVITKIKYLTGELHNQYRILPELLMSYMNKTHILKRKKNNFIISCKE